MAIIGDANPEMLAELAQGKDLIIDATDNFETRWPSMTFHKNSIFLGFMGLCRKLWHELYDYSWEDTVFKLPIKVHSNAARNDL